MKKQKVKGLYRLFILIILVLLFLTIASIAIMYKIVYQEKRSLLHEVCMNQKEVIQSIYTNTSDVNDVIDVLYKQREITEGLGATGEFTIGYLRNDSIVFLIRSRQKITTNYLPIAENSDKAAPLKYALSDNTGYVEGLDYKGNQVLAYCTYIPELKWGLVAKMDISEVRLPFYRAGLYAVISSLILFLVASILFRKVSRPLAKKIAESEENYRRLFEYSAIPIWKEDFSEIKKYFDKLKNSGVNDFRTYFGTHKDEVSHLASLIKVVEINQKSVEFFEVESKEDVIRNMLFYFTDASLEVFREELTVLAEGGMQFECEIPIRTLTGDIKTLDLHLSVVKGYEDTLSNILVSFIDITERKNNEERIRRSRQEWMETFDLIPDMITILDNQHRIVRANKAAVDKLGVSPQDIIGLHCYNCVHGMQESPPFCPHSLMLKDGKEHVADFHEEKLGMDLLVSVTPIYNSNGNITGSVHIARDITEHKKKEKELHILNRTLSALGKSSQEMTRARDESDYLDEVCKIIINDCGHLLVWIGYAEENEEKIVRTVAFSGFEEGYLEKLNITWSDTERGNGPTGTAIRTGKPAICKNMLTDPAFEPWRKDAIKRGYASSVVLPLKTDGKTFGAISIYSKEPDSFTNDEIELLSELANDLSYGIISIRTRVAQKEAEEALRKSEERVRIKLQSILSPEGDIKQLELADIIDIPSIQSLMNNLHELVHIPMAIIDMDGKVLVGVGWQDICTKFHRVHPETCKNCIESDVQLSRGIPEGKYRLYKCNNNLWDIATPVTIGGEQKGNLFMGQFFFDDESIDYDFFKTQAKKYDFNEKEYIAALEKVPRLSRKKLDYAKSFFSNLAQSLSQLSYSNIKLARSISEQERIENALKEKNAELIESNATKDKFFKIIAHDMKNPFISLLGASELLYENAEKYDIKKIVKLTKILNDSAKSGYDMLLNMLDWSRSQAGSMLFQPEKINLKELMDKNLSNLFEYSSDKKINLNFNIAGNIQVNADKNMLEVILRNLVNNALKFTPKGGDVTVGTINEKDAVTVFVKDTGVGIEKSDFDKLFRTDIKYSNPGTEHEGGTGLGLLLCKEFIEKHGGKIWLESEPGKGTTFFFNLGDAEKK
jgi:PAS domain S-box-containing protein